MRPPRGIEEAALVLLFSGCCGDEEHSAEEQEFVKIAVGPRGDGGQRLTWEHGGEGSGVVMEDGALGKDGAMRLHGVEVRVSKGTASGEGKVVGKRVLSFSRPLEEPDEYVK